VHRDYHPGNVLWAGGKISGVVDWASVRIGAPEVDVGECRSDLVSSLGIAAADRFLNDWLSAAGRDSYDPYWDVVATLGGREQEDLACLDAGDRALLQRAVAER
jgi:aminoglycoside phosphotransferase (APT) family kinase protein